MRTGLIQELAVEHIELEALQDEVQLVTVEIKERRSECQRAHLKIAELEQLHQQRNDQVRNSPMTTIIMNLPTMP